MNWKPIPREGEQQFASIHRNRSGENAGGIDYGIRVADIDNLSPAEKDELLRTSAAMHECIKEYCKHEYST